MRFFIRGPDWLKAQHGTKVALLIAVGGSSVS